MKSHLDEDFEQIYLIDVNSTGHSSVLAETALHGASYDSPAVKTENILTKPLRSNSLKNHWSDVRTAGERS